MRLAFACGFVAVVGLSSLGAFGAGQVADVRLTALTLPSERLPEGCVLPPNEPIDPGPRPQAPGLTPQASPGSVRRLPVTATNPWTPAESRDKAQIYRMIEGASRLPDGPPMTARDVQRFEGKVIADIEEAYVAVYTAPGEPDIRVWALRYTRPAPVFDIEHRAYRVGIRYASGHVVAVIQARERGPCFDAINAHLRSVIVK